MYVIADGADNSVTLSKRLVKDMCVMDMTTQPKVIVFKVMDGYGFMVDPEVDQETQLNDIQYNEKHHTIGFESLCPTVNRILYDYGLPQGRYKLAIKKHRSKGKVFYAISKPNGKHLG
jgi:hypothetical protein